MSVEKRMSPETEEQRRERMKKLTMEAIQMLKEDLENPDPKVQAELKKWGIFGRKI